MKARIGKIALFMVLSAFSVNATMSQVSKDLATYTNYKFEEKRTELEIHNLKSAKRLIEMQYEKIAIAQVNVDIQMLLSLTHPDYKAYAHGGDVWDIKKLEMYWAGGLKNVVSTEELANDIKTFRLNKDTAVVLVNQRWNRHQWMAGKIRDVHTNTDQTETWIHTNEGWKRWKVEDVTNKVALVDGKRVDITKPYDPDAPEAE